MARAFALLLMFLTTACVSTLERPPSPDGERIEISYSEGVPVCSPCESLSIVMTSDGKAMWIYGRGSYERWMEERHPIPFSPELFQAWKAQIEALDMARARVIGTDGAKGVDTIGCEVSEQHSPYRIIKFESEKGKRFFALELSCDPEKYRELHAFFAAFPSQLGLPDKIAKSRVVTSRFRY